jgi:hypothetical protein
VGLGLKGYPLNLGDLVRVIGFVHGLPQGTVAAITCCYDEEDAYGLKGYEHVRVKAVELEVLAYSTGPQ